MLTNSCGDSFSALKEYKFFEVEKVRHKVRTILFRIMVVAPRGTKNTKMIEIDGFGRGHWRYRD